MYRFFSVAVTALVSLPTSPAPQGYCPPNVVEILVAHIYGAFPHVPGTVVALTSNVRRGLSLLPFYGWGSQGTGNIQSTYGQRVRTEFAHSPFLVHQRVRAQASAWRIRCREGKQCGQGQATDEHHARGQKGARQGPDLLLGLREPERSNRLSLFLLSPWGCFPPRLVHSHLRAHVHSHTRSTGRAGEH